MEGAGMSDVDTSRDRVEGLARVHDIGAHSYGDDNDAGLIALASTTAATLRALLAERDAARAEVAEAFARGAEAMRERAAHAAWERGAWACNEMDSDSAIDRMHAQPRMDMANEIRAAIRALPLPEPEAPR
jgi:hypothetical protein